MTVNQALEALNRVPVEQRELELYGIHGASGMSFDVSIYGEAETNDYERAGPLDDLRRGAEFIPVYLG